jgi:hypothetical protein
MTTEGGGRVEEMGSGIYRVWMDDGRCSKWRVPGVKITRYTSKQAILFLMCGSCFTKINDQ